MKRFELCGLPGITLQGRKGTAGHRGSKLIFYSSSDSVNNSNTEISGNPVNIILKDTTLTINEYFKLDGTTYPGYAESLNEIATYAFPDDAIDIFENDFLLYSDKNGATLYLITDDCLSTPVVETTDESESTESDAPIIIYKLLWKIDKWKYASDPLQTSENTILTIRMYTSKLDSSITWDGTYNVEEVPCIPAGFVEDNNIGAGHFFNIITDDDFKTEIINNVGEDTIHVGDENRTITGSVYLLGSDEKTTNEPALYVGLMTYVRATSVWGDIWGGGDNIQCTAVDSEGNFSLDLPAGTNYVAFRVQDKNKKYLPLTKIVTADEAEDILNNGIEFHVLPWPKGIDDINSYQINVVDKYNVYNTSVFHNSEEPIYCKTIKISSKLTFKENSRLKLEAEFVPKGKLSNINIAAVSSCWPEHYIIPEGTEVDTAIYNSNCPNGIAINMSNKFNFDKENLRTFTVVLKDFNKGNSDILYDTGIKIPMYIYENYDMNIYAYYRTGSSSFKKFFLDPEKYIEEIE